MPLPPSLQASQTCAAASAGRISSDPSMSLGLHCSKPPKAVEIGGLEGAGARLVCPSWPSWLPSMPTPVALYTSSLAHSGLLRWTLP